MNLKIVSYAMTYIALFYTGIAYAQCGNTATDNECVRQYIQEVKIMIGNTYSNPDNVEQEAINYCCLEKIRDPNKFKDKYKPNNEKAKN